MREDVPSLPDLAVPQELEGQADATPPSSPFKCSARGTHEVVLSLPNLAAPQEPKGYAQGALHPSSAVGVRALSYTRCYWQKLLLRKGLGNHPPMMPMDEHSSIVRAWQHRLRRPFIPPTAQALGVHVVPLESRLQLRQQVLEGMSRPYVLSLL